ncbi:MAG: hypothetical protein ABJB40_11155 [Acidobacteriota bacterium]
MLSVNDDAVYSWGSEGRLPPDLYGFKELSLLLHDGTKPLQMVDDHQANHH